VRAVLTIEQCQHTATVQAKALANEVNERCCHETAVLVNATLAKEQCHQESAERAALELLAVEFRQLLATFDLLAAEFGQQRATLNLLAAALADLATLAETALAKEQSFHVAAEHTTVLAGRSLADEN
jgi:hypothetical protein